MKVEKVNFKEQLAQVICDDSEDALAIELRDKENKILKLIYLDLKSGEMWTIEEELSWWYQLQACSQGKLILNGFEDPGLPMTKGLYVFDAKAGRKLWEQPLSHFLYQSSGGVWVEQDEKKHFLNLEDGNSAMPPSENVQKSYEQNFQSDYHACEVIYRLDDRFPFLHSKIEKLWRHKTEDYLDHLIIGDKEILSYPHKNPNGGWDQEIAILEKEKIQMARKTSSQLKGISWSTFFIWRKFLIWQEDYKSLCFSDLG